MSRGVKFASCFKLYKWWSIKSHIKYHEEKGTKLHDCFGCGYETKRRINCLIHLEATDMEYKLGGGEVGADLEAKHNAFNIDY